MLSLTVSAQSPRIVREGDTFRVIGYEASGQPPSGGWPDVFQIFTGDRNGPAVMGNYEVRELTLTFLPRFSLSASRGIVAVFRPPGGSVVEAIFPAELSREAPTTVVSRVYPNVDELPANLLKFYLYFSAPMQRGEVWKHIQLFNSRNQPVDLPFLEIDQELWDKENRRLTILFDPGRIKRGVLPREDAGTALQPGENYTLHIGASWLDAKGQPLKQEYRKVFRVAQEDRTPIDPAKWKLKLPRADSPDPLELTLGESLDQALLERMLTVEANGLRVAGKVELNDTASVWRFRPESPWRPIAYQINIDSTLEDLAGNKVLRAFDVDVFDKVTVRQSVSNYKLRFRLNRK